jgi:hypothetical protein
MNIRTEEHITTDGEVIVAPGAPTLVPQASLAVSLARAEVDQQITTAHAYPRSVDRAVKNIMSLATLDDETAEECVYALPRGGKPIKGPSVRLAEIIAGQWGNCRVGARVVHVDRFEKFVEAEGVFHDLETNAATTARVRRRISDRQGRVFNDDMIVVTGNAACAIAKRNAILGAVPKAVWRKAYSAVEQVIAGDIKTLSERRDRAMKAFAAFGVTPDQVFQALNIAGADDIALDHITTLVGMHAALKSGESTVEEMFPRQPPAGAVPKDLAGKLDVLAEGGERAASTTDQSNSAASSTAAAEPSGAGATEAGQAEGTTTASPAANQASSTQPRDAAASAASGQAAPKSETSPRKNDKGAATAADTSSNTVPKNEAEFVAYATGWISALDDADAGEKRWKEEKSLRNKANVGEEVREDLKQKLDTKVREIRDADQS